FPRLSRFIPVSQLSCPLTAMNTFEKTADTPAVVVMPEMAITPIPSGSLVTSGQLTAAIERGLSL
ncbi:hypothetical protein, partial [Oscillibacter sp.]|uniref:hypothetical protein n=1 Tax=Oscillibacter sp. TaxID=1945593 RepID=UPI00289F082E